MTTNCAHCNTPFQSNPSRKCLYCSSRCKKAARRLREPNKICEHCGKGYYVSPSQKTPSRYCSNPCFRAGNNTFVTLHCEVCGTEYQKGPSAAKNSRFCSVKCKSLFLSKQFTKGPKPANATCKACGKEYYVKPRELLRTNYCSKECYTHTQKASMNATCLHCGKEYHMPPCQIRITRFCSRHCDRRYKGETNIERFTREGLTDLLINFVQEYPLGRYHIDFYLPEMSIALEVDGTYWHRNRQARDRAKDVFIQSQGLVPIRISEAEIMKTFHSDGNVVSLLRSILHV